MLRGLRTLSAFTVLSMSVVGCDQGDSPGDHSERRGETPREDEHDEASTCEGASGPEQPRDDGASENCADVLFNTYDACATEAGIDTSGDSLSEAEHATLAGCWIEVANGAFDACCEATPDDTCIETSEPDQCESTPMGESIDYGDSCAAVLFETNDACLREAGSLYGDLDGNCEIDTDAEFELVSRCWIDVANGAFDACCAVTPDETCDEGESAPR